MRVFGFGKDFAIAWIMNHHLSPVESRSQSTNFDWDYPMSYVNLVQNYYHNTSNSPQTALFHTGILVENHCKRRGFKYHMDPNVGWA